MSARRWYFRDTSSPLECDKLSSWESGFVESVAEQFERKGELSDKQCETLNRIYEERTQ